MIKSSTIYIENTDVGLNRLNQLSWIYLLIERERGESYIKRERETHIEMDREREREGRKLYKERERDTHTYRDGQREREREREYSGLGERGTDRQTEKEDTEREKGDWIGREIEKGDMIGRE